MSARSSRVVFVRSLRLRRTRRPFSLHRLRSRRGLAGSQCRSLVSRSIRACSSAATAEERAGVVEAMRVLPRMRVPGESAGDRIAWLSCPPALPLTHAHKLRRVNCCFVCRALYDRRPSLPPGVASAAVYFLLGVFCSCSLGARAVSSVRCLCVLLLSRSRRDCMYSSPACPSVVVLPPAPLPAPTASHSTFSPITSHLITSHLTSGSSLICILFTNKPRVALSAISLARPYHGFFALPFAVTPLPARIDAQDLASFLIADPSLSPCKRLLLSIRAKELRLECMAQHTFEWEMHLRVHPWIMRTRFAMKPEPCSILSNLELITRSLDTALPRRICGERLLRIWYGCGEDGIVVQRRQQGTNMGLRSRPCATCN